MSSARRRGRTRVSASPAKPFTRRINRDIMPGGPRGGEPSGARSRSDNVAALLSRLRRLEVVVLTMSGHLRETGSLKVMLDKMLDLRNDTKDVPDGD